MENNTYDQGSNESNNYGQPMQTQNNYGEQGNYQLDLEPAVTMGEWLVSLLILMIPCVGVIMMFVWAFSKAEKKSKSNFFKAQLIFSGILFVLWFVFMIIFGAGVIGAIGSTM